MTRGRGVLLQRYKDGGLSDTVAFNLAEGLSWRSGDRTRTETDVVPWTGKRAQAGRLAPKGFPEIEPVRLTRGPRRTLAPPWGTGA